MLVLVAYVHYVHNLEFCKYSLTFILASKINDGRKMNFVFRYIDIKCKLQINYRKQAT